MGKSSTPTVTPVSNLTGGQKTFLDALFKYIGGTPGTAGTPGQYVDDGTGNMVWNPGTPGTPGTPGQIGQGIAPYPGPTTTGASDLQSGAFDIVNQILSGKAPLQGQTQAGLESVLQPFNSNLATDTWRRSVEAPALADWQQNVLPGIEEKFAGYNAMGGGGAQKALLDAGTNLTTGLEKNLADIVFADKNASNQQLLQAAGISSSIPYDTANTGLQAGTAQRQITLDQILEPYTKFQQSQPYNNPWVNMGLSGLNVNALTNAVTPAASSSVPGILGGVGSLAGGVAKLLPFLTSDRRLKTDITESSRGLDAVERLSPRDFRWKKTGQADTGFIAQEVREVIPEAVIEGEDGFLRLDATKIIGPLVNAIKQLAGRVDQLEFEQGE